MTKHGTTHHPDCRRYDGDGLVHLDLHHCDGCNTLSIILRLTEWVAIPERVPTP